MSEPFVVPKFNWQKDKPDPRDYLYRGRTLSTKPKVDLRPLCSPVEDQGYLGSCTGNAVAGAIEYLYRLSKVPVDVSRLFIYYYARYYLGTINYDSGAYIRDAIKSTSKFGASLESLWPYNVRMFTREPTMEAKKDGVKRKITRYERALNLGDVFNALTSSFPVIIGFYVYESFFSRNVSKTGIMPYPNVDNEKLLGGHAVLLVGYDMVRKTFIARNSWGAGWGDRGYFYMPFQVIDNPEMSDDFWVIKSINIPK